MAHIGYHGPPCQIYNPNHTSATRIHQEINDNIKQELENGRITKIDSLPPAFISSPLGAVQKKQKGAHTGWRRINDLSYPQGFSVNDGIPTEFSSLKYQTLDDAISLIAKHGRHTTLRKRDLKDAFRRRPVSPYDYWLLIFEWDGQFYIDLALAFGMSTSPFIFNFFSEGLHWIIENNYNQSVAHYLDDFLLVGCQDQDLFSKLCERLGFEEKLSKAMDGYVVDFTGIELDSDKMEARLPEDKLTRARSAVEQTLCQGFTSYKALNSLLGFLSFCTRVTPLGRPFLRQLFNFMQNRSTTHPNAKRRLTTQAKSDLRWWLVFLNNWTGIRLIRQHRRDLHVYTDASGAKGIGAWHGSNAFAIRMP